MKILNLSSEATFDRCRLIIDVPKGEAYNIGCLIENVGQINQDQDYDVIVHKKKVKRSLDSNAYFWTLCNKLAQRLKLTDIEVYRELVKDYGQFVITPVRAQNIEHWRHIWGGNGIGWIIEDLGECKLPELKGYHNIKSYYGTHVYSTQEMSRLIDGLIYECKKQKIETLTPQQLAEMLEREDRT